MNRAAQAARVPGLPIANRLVSVVLFILFVIHFVLHKAEFDVYSTVILVLAVILLVLGPIARLKVGPQGIDVEVLQRIEKKVDENSEELDRLKKKLNALGHIAVLEQVSALNRLVIEHPHLGRLWGGMDNLDDEKIREIFYVFGFVDAFEMLVQFQRGEHLGEEYCRLWSDVWMPLLKGSAAGTLMSEMDMFKYYSRAAKDALGLGK